MFGRKKLDTKELDAKMEERIKLRFREFENERILPFLRQLVANFDAAINAQIDEDRINSETFRDLFVVECKTPWELELPLLEDEFLESGDMPEWMDIARTLGKHDYYGQWFNGQFDHQTDTVLSAAAQQIGFALLRKGIDRNDPEWRDFDR